MNRRPSSLGRSQLRIVAGAIRALLVAGVVGAWELGAQSNLLNTSLLPAPSRIAAEVWSTLGTTQFLADLRVTASEVGIASIVAIPIGFLIGVAFWRLPLVGRAYEPFLAAMYAIPIVVLYPILLVWMGLNSWPIITLAVLLGLVPVALNTAIALRSVPSVLTKLARSVNCSRWQTYRHVLLPAALPVFVSGVQLAFVYILIITVAMEFLVATAGLGYRVGLHYTNFRVLPMWAGIVIVLSISVLAIATLNSLASRIRRDMA